MVRKLIEKNVDIYNYPDEFEAHSGSLTIGDLHGNAIKLLHFLLRHAVIKFKDGISEPATYYHKFVTLYDQCGDITRLYLDKNYESALQKLPEIISQFNQLVSQLEIKNKFVLVRLVGDELADRGSNDYLTLRLLDLLHKNNIQTTIIMSNHNSEFIKAYENLRQHNSFDPQGGIMPEQKCSLYGLKLLFDEGIISPAELASLVNNTWLPALKILDYTLNEQGICLFTHAPVRFDIIQLIASHLGVNYHDCSKEMLGTTIDHINARFQQILKENTAHDWLNTTRIDQPDQMTDAEINKAPLIYIIWNRWNASVDTANARPAFVNNYQVCYVHGHDPFQSLFAQVINLDTPCGKLPRRELQRNIQRATQIIMNDGYERMLKADVRQYLADVTRYKVLDSDESGLIT